MTSEELYSYTIVINAAKSFLQILDLDDRRILSAAVLDRHIRQLEKVVENAAAAQE